MRVKASRGCEKKFILWIILAGLMVVEARGQSPRSHFSFVTDLGANYLLNRGGSPGRIGRCGSVGFNFMTIRPKRPFHFVTGIHFNVNSYRSSISGSGVRVNQMTFRLRMETLFRPARRKAYWRGGIFIDRLSGSSIAVITRSANSQTGILNPSVADDYFPTVVQAGIMAGLSWPLMMFGREQLFTVSCAQHVSRIVDGHYRMNTASTIVSESARPLELTAGIAFTLQKGKNAKAAEPAE